MMNKRFRYLLVVGVLFHLLSYFDVGSEYFLAIAPLALGALAAAGGVALNDITNQLNKKNAEYSIDQQKKLMDYSWSKYNSPKAQAKAYADAGFNPSVAFGQGGMSAPIAPNVDSPNLEQGQVGLSGQDMAQTILALSEAKKAGSDAAGVDLDNKIKNASLDELIKSASLANKWTVENTNKVMQEAYNIQGLNTKIQEEINLLRKEGQKLDFENEHWLQNFNAQMREFADKHNIDAQTFEQMKEQAPFILDKLKSEATMFSLDADIQGEYKEVNAKLGVIGQVLNFVSQFLNKR